MNKSGNHNHYKMVIMKKFIGILLIVAMLMCFACSCQKTDVDIIDTGTGMTTSHVEESLREKLIRDIDGAYRKELELPESSTTIGMVEVADKYREKWQQIADEYYEKIMEFDGITPSSDIYYNSDDLHTFLSNMKSNWEQYNQVQCENYVKTLQTIYGTGTIVGPLFAMYQYEMQKDWALQIVDICQQLRIQ